MRRFPSVFILTFLIVILPFCLPVLAGERFTDNKNGTITDHQLSLMWAAGDNLGDTDWHQAQKWIRFTFPLSLPVNMETGASPLLKNSSHCT